MISPWSFELLTSDLRRDSRERYNAFFASTVLKFRDKHNSCGSKTRLNKTRTQGELVTVNPLFDPLPDMCRNRIYFLGSIFQSVKVWPIEWEEHFGMFSHAGTLMEVVADVEAR